MFSGKRISKRTTIHLAEETGWHIGDGSMNFYNNKDKSLGIYQLRGHIVEDRPHYDHRIKPIFKLLYGINVNLREMPSTGVYGFQLWNNDLVSFKKKLGLPLGKKSNISIPKIFLKSDPLKIAVIRGIFDTDGGIYLEPKNKKLYPRVYITTISSILAEQLQILLIGLGFKATKDTESANEKYGRIRPAYRVSIRGHEMFHKFMKLIKPKNQKHVDKYIFYTKGF